MNKWIIGLVTVVIVAAGVSVSLAIQHRTQIGLRERKASFEQQAGQLAQLSVENERLSNIVVQLQNSQPLAGDQLRELLRLRNEAGQLSGVATETQQLQANNARLKGIEAKAKQQLAEAQAAPNYWARDQLSFAGYADPESTVRTMLWYMNSGDVSAWKSICSPEALTAMNSEWDRHRKTEAQRVAEMKAMGLGLVSGSVGFHVVDRTMTSPTEAVVNLSFDGEGKTRKFVLHRIGNEWKFHQMIFAGEEVRGR